MKRTIIFSILLLTVVATSRAQQVKILPIDLFSDANIINPVVIDSVLYFSSNKKNSIAVNYFNSDESRLYQLYYVKLKNRKPSGLTHSFFRNSNRVYNQVGVTFAGIQPIVSQNDLTRDSYHGHPLGIFIYNDRSDSSNGSEIVKDLGKSNAAYPSISPDGKTMIFASDKDGGYGSSDLYVCKKVAGSWTEPQNMGPDINTKEIETAPFIHDSGVIFFASNGRPDSRRLDIYYTYPTKDGYAKPEKLDIGVNSAADDYGFFYSKNEEWGYVTSNRQGKERIYYFEETFPKFDNPQPYEEENLCYTFYESSAENYDASEFSFKWSFSDGATISGLEVDHCFKGPGTYDVALSVYDKTTNEEMFSLVNFPFEIEHKEQLKINCLAGVIHVGQKIQFDVDASGVKQFQPTKFYWDFGQGSRVKGKQVSTEYKKPGTYRVMCGTIDDNDRSVRVSNYIEITVVK